jgi:hypothetical protein
MWARQQFSGKFQADLKILQPSPRSRAICYERWRQMMAKIAKVVGISLKDFLKIKSR